MMWQSFSLSFFPLCCPLEPSFAFKEPEKDSRHDD